jgi:hypothetical protein
MSGDYPQFGTYFYADDDGYYDGVENTRRPWYPKRSDLFRNANNAKAQINRAAKPVEIDFSSFCYQIPAPNTITPEHTSDNSDIFDNVEDNIESEISYSSLEDNKVVKEELDHFELAINSFEFEKSDLIEKHDEISRKLVPEQLDYEDRNHLLETIVSKCEKIDDVVSSIGSADFQTRKKDFLSDYRLFNLPPILDHKTQINLTTYQRDLLLKIINFDDTKIKPPNKNFLVYVAYLCHGGEEDKFLKQYGHNFEQQAVTIADIKTKFKEYFNTLDKIKSKLKRIGKFESQAYKYFFHKHNKFFKNKILFCRHPNQLPYYYRDKEIILIPTNIDLSDDETNYSYFSLLAVRGKTKIISDRNGYWPALRKALLF